MKSEEVRNRFLEFFKSKGHEIVPSAPLVVKDDPTLMFTNAGMNQFKDYFLGNIKSKYNRIADTQKCLRVSGKHNDLEEVGIDTYHHTMFEMLGNWSFGNYFKKETIKWAWELLVSEYKLPENRIYVTVFGGDEAEGLKPDEESLNLWQKFLPEDRIIYFGKKDNFWEMGKTGPCGPCSEIHIDLRPEEEIRKTPGSELINKDHPLVIEIWNLVFIQFNRTNTGMLENLPQKHVDTGLGLERLTMAIQHKTSNYDTDLFQPLIRFVGSQAGVTYGESEETDIALRVTVDHIRAVSFAITDGQLPSNTGAGYVIRRILRRAVRYGFTYLNFTEPFLYRIVPLLTRQFESIFPELQAQQEHVKRVIKEEELAFLKTLENGLRMIDTFLSSKRKEDEFEITGETIFMLYDTYGFPKDLTMLILRERGFEQKVSEEWEAQFKRSLQKQKERSRADAVVETGDWIELNGKTSVEFVGYQHLEHESKIIKYRQVKDKSQNIVQIVLDKTPFYAESGGQVGDTGYIENKDEKIRIFDTKKEHNLIVHYAEKVPDKVKAKFTARVNKENRLLTMNNHSATHLMHAALREVLGSHVEQRGSLVNPKLLRFDFSHFAKMTDEEIQKVEEIVNQKIRESIPTGEKRDVPLKEAKKMGARALFGEKYGERVRVIIFDEKFSVELCGGTHVSHTGHIGFFKIVSESSIAAGVRRIEALTAVAAEKYVCNLEGTIKEVKTMLNDPKHIPTAIENLKNVNKRLETDLELLHQKQAGAVKQELLKNIESKNGASVIIQRVDISDSAEIKNIAFQLKNQVENLFMVLGAVVDDKPLITVMISDSLVRSKGMHAGTIVQELAREIKGGGGGQPFFATAGGKDISGLDSALEKAKDYVVK